MILDFTFPTTPSNSPLHRGRTRCIATLKHLLASVSPPVQGGAGGGSPYKPYELYKLFISSRTPAYPAT